MSLCSSAHRLRTRALGPPAEASPTASAAYPAVAPRLARSGVEASRLDPKEGVECAEESAHSQARSAAATSPTARAAGGHRREAEALID